MELTLKYDCLIEEEKYNEILKLILIQEKSILNIIILVLN